MAMQVSVAWHIRDSARVGSKRNERAAASNHRSDPRKDRVANQNAVVTRTAHTERLGAYTRGTWRTVAWVRDRLRELRGKAPNAHTAVRVGERHGRCV